MKKFLSNKYCRLVRLQSLPFYLEIVAGMILALYPKFTNFNISFTVMMIISFQLVYHSVYINNDLLDLKQDRLDPVKSKRPIAASEISIEKALTISIILLSTGLAFGYLISITLFLFELLMVSYNLVYSLLLKKIPYVDSLANGVTHSIRFLLGMVISGGTIYPSIIISIFLISDIFSIFKRIEEMERKSYNRKTLKYYKNPYTTLNQYLVIMLLFTTTYYTRSNITLAIAGTTSLVGMISVILYENNKKFRFSFNKFFNF